MLPGSNDMNHHANLINELKARMANLLHVAFECRERSAVDLVRSKNYQDEANALAKVIETLERRPDGSNPDVGVCNAGSSKG